MRERPILFSAPMVRAILEGRKTQTRRVVKPQPTFDRRGVTAAGWAERDGLWMFPNVAPEVRIRCPYGQPGDRLWVRETWCGFIDEPYYRATAIEDGMLPEEVAEERWKPSIHMPRRVSRIDLEVTGVRVERLQDISEEDACAEGAPLELAPPDYVRLGAKSSYRGGFQRLWESINGPENWDANPWVWVVEFKRVKP